MKRNADIKMRKSYMFCEKSFLDDPAVDVY